MFVEIRKFKFTCNICGKEEIKEDTWFHPPEGWINEKILNPHAMFNCNKDICPNCAKKDNK